MQTAVINHPSSYRDPSGFIFEKNGALYRQVNNCFKEDFDHFINSGCYQHLVNKNLLTPHTEVNENLTGSAEYYKTLFPKKIEFISYCYEWSFDMLKDAALLTLQISKEILPFGVMLKDASPYNIQWHEGKFIFIDTLSFEKYESDKPWVAYRQFCENFLGPLLVSHYSKVPLHQLQLAYPDGIPLQVIHALLPLKSYFSLYTYLHIHLHNRIAVRAHDNEERRNIFSEKKLRNLISSLESLVRSLKLKDRKSTWSGYYGEAATRNNYLQQKQQIIESWLNNLDDLETAADLGANEGEFSKLLSKKNIKTIAADFDPYCINRLYNKVKREEEKNIIPLIIDLSNPSPSIGLNNKEQPSFIKRVKADIVFALALIHHLAIGKNIPFNKVAEFFSLTGKYLVIEFVPKEDEMVQLMLKQKEIIYSNYNETVFLSAFKKHFDIIKKKSIADSSRVLYLMKRIE